MLRRILWGSSVQTVRTFHAANILVGIGGLIGVWHASHSWAAVAWAFVAGIHFSMPVKREG